jgi:hypothetical protein
MELIKPTQHFKKATVKDVKEMTENTRHLGRTWKNYCTAKNSY